MRASEGQGMARHAELESECTILHVQGTSRIIVPLHSDKAGELAPGASELARREGQCQSCDSVTCVPKLSMTEVHTGELINTECCAIMGP
eukprot:s565_g7.t1